MPDLRSIKSLNQISSDRLLNIPKQPLNTCPLIDALKFGGQSCSKIYEIKLGNNPANIIINTKELISRIDELENWSKGVISLANSVTSIEDCEYIDFLSSKITKAIDNNKNYLMVQSEYKINNLIREWIGYNRLSEFYTEHNSLNIRFSLLKAFFTEATNEFDQLLENVRMNNHELRENTHSLKLFILPNLRCNYDLTQPMAYLKTIEKGENEISLGLIESDDNQMNYFRLIQYLKFNKAINDTQFNMLRVTESKSDILNILKLNGYEKIYYYENLKNFLQDRDDYKIEMKTPKMRSEFKILKI